MRVLQALVLTTLTACSAVALADGRGCVLDSTESLAGISREGFLAQAPGPGEVPAQVRYVCEDERVESVSVRLVPGGSAQARLLLSNVPERFARIQSREAAPKSWIRVDSQRLDDQVVLVTLHIDLPESVRPDTRHTALIRFAPTAEGDATFVVPLKMEVEQGGSLFRDQFDPRVDPSIGQFSMAF